MNAARRCAMAFIIFSPTIGVSARAQATQDNGDSFRSEIFAGSQPENYLRYLQTMGLVPLYPWSSRAFSPREVDRLIPRDTAHPWRDRFVSSAVGPYDFARDGGSSVASSTRCFLSCA